MTPSDIAGLSERLREIRGKLTLDIDREWLGAIDEAATALDSLSARVKELEAENTSLAIRVEKMICAKLGREWTPSGISVVSLIDELSDRALRAEQQRDEAYERCIRAVRSSLDIADALESIRRLASGPEGGSEGEK